MSSSSIPTYGNQTTGEGGSRIRDMTYFLSSQVSAHNIKSLSFMISDTLKNTILVLLDIVSRA